MTLTADQHRALFCLPAMSTTPRKPSMLAHDFKREMLAGLVQAGFVTVVQKQ
jgi:hypothetical protein